MTKRAKRKERARQERVEAAKAAFDAGTIPAEVVALLAGPDPTDEATVAAWIAEHQAEREGGVEAVEDVAFHDGLGALIGTATLDSPPGVHSMSNRIVVGVRAWDGAESAETSGDREWSASIGCAWVEVDGVRVPGNVVDVTLGPVSGEEFETVLIRLICGKFETVPSSPA